MNRQRLTPWLLLAGILMPFVADPSGLGVVLQNSPFVDFTDVDYKQFFAAVKQAADGPVGAPSSNWANPQSGAQGDVQSVRAFHRAEGDCRELSGTNTARGRAEPYRITVCKASDGSWRLAPSEPAKASAAPPPDPSGFPVKLPASFTGTLPCADCPGMKYQLEFLEDGSYKLRTTYLEKGPDKKGLSVDDAGAWQLVSYNKRVTLRDEKNGTMTFLIKNPSTLRLVDAKGDEMKSKLNYDLVRDQTYTAIDGFKP